MLSFDSKYPRPVLGIDEVGTGCIAGPVYAAGVVIPDDREIREALIDMGINDSKKLTDNSRRRLYRFIEEQNFFRVVVDLPPSKVSRWGNTTSVDYLFTKIVAAFRETHDGGTVLIDGNSRNGVKVAHVAVVKGDNKSLAIAAASIVAKVERDNVMIELAEKYPGYGWERNKGYVSKEHREALMSLGPVTPHRTHTEPVKQAIAARKRRQEEASE
jgi:ribonuclease HII